MERLEYRSESYFGWGNECTPTLMYHRAEYKFFGVFREGPQSRHENVNHAKRSTKDECFVFLFFSVLQVTDSSKS